MRIGEAIRRRRVHLDMSQIGLAQAVGVTQSHVSKIENGHHSPKLELLEKIAQMLQASVLDLLASHDDPLSVDWYGIETLRQLRILRSYSNYDEMLGLIRSAEGADFFRITRNQLELMQWKAFCLASLGEYAQAKVICDRFFETRPEYPDLSLILKFLVVLGCACRNLGELDESRRYLERSLRLGHAHPVAMDAELQRDLFYNLGCTYRACGQLTEASAILERLRRIDSERKYQELRRTGDTLFALGEICALQGSMDCALSCFEEAHQDYAAIHYEEGCKAASVNVQAARQTVTD